MSIKLNKILTEHNAVSTVIYNFKFAALYFQNLFLLVFAITKS